jgi:hypothetical protein
MAGNRNSCVHSVVASKCSGASFFGWMSERASTVFWIRYLSFPVLIILLCLQVLLSYFW